MLVYQRVPLISGNLHTRKPTELRCPRGTDLVGGESHHRSGDDETLQTT